MKYTVMRTHRDLHGIKYHVRVDMGKYVLATAKRKADKVRGGYVCKLGTNTPIYVGGMQ